MTRRLLQRNGRGNPPFLDGAQRGLLTLLLIPAIFLITFNPAFSSPTPTPDPILQRTDKNNDGRTDAKDLVEILHLLENCSSKMIATIEVGLVWYKRDIAGESEDATPTLEAVTWTPTGPGGDAQVTPTPTPSPSPVDASLFYYGQNRRIFLTPSEVKLGVVFVHSVSEEESLEFLADYPELLEFDRKDSNALPGPLIVHLVGALKWEALKELLHTLAKDPRVDYMTPVFTSSSPQESLLSNRFNLRFKSGIPESEIDDLNARNDVTVVEFPTRQNGFVYRLTPRDFSNSLCVLDMANRYFETGLVEWSQPTFSITNVFPRWLLPSTGAYSEDLESVFNYSDVYLSPSRIQLAIGLRISPITRGSKMFLESLGEIKIIGEGHGEPQPAFMNLKREYKLDELISLISELTTDQNLSYVSPVFVGGGGQRRFLTGEFIVKPMNPKDRESIRSLNERYDVEILEYPTRQRGYTYLLRYRGTALESLFVVNRYSEHPLIHWAEPNFRITNTLFSPTPIPTPDDTHFPDQWHLSNVGQDPPNGTSGADVDALLGWALEKGDSSTVIAIVDTGIDMTHPDLDALIWSNPNESVGDANSDGAPGVANVDDDGDGLTDEDSADNEPGDPGYLNDLDDDDDENGYADDINGWDFHDNDNDPQDVAISGHGSNVAGLAAAEADNDLGVVGVSWASRLMAVKVYPSGGGIPEPDNFAKGIRYAADNGADVLNNSWGFYDKDSIAVADEIANARNNGRSGKGCLVIFASGNLQEEMSDESKLDQVIAVGSTDQNDTRVSGSNFGEALDVVAPSNGGILATTDMQGGDGINNGSYSGDYTNDTDYTKIFSGTSGSAPQVAGLAALLLSQNPNLTAAEVQSIIQVSAEDQVGPAPAPTVTPEFADSGGWDENYGWGRINVYNALATETALPGGASRSLQRFEVKNGSPTPTPVFAIDQFGFLYLKGSLKGTKVPTRHATDYSTPIPTPNPNKDEWHLKNNSGTPIALVDAESGDLFIGGSVTTKNVVPTPNPSKDEFRIKDEDGTPVALITEDGDLYLKGDYYNESNP